MSKTSMLAAVMFALFAVAPAAVRAQQQQQPTPAASNPQTPAAAATPPTTTTTTTAPVLNTAGHEYAPLQEKTLNYKNWTFKSLSGGEPVELRQWAHGKKLVMVVYFAPWCGNWKMESPVVSRLYDKYKKDGFDIIAVSNYAPVEDARAHFKDGVPYTVVVESESREARDKTNHYAYRQACGDARRWGSPFNIFLEPAKLAKDGDVLTEKAWVVGGELIEEEVEKFIRERLGLAALKTD